MEGQNAMVFAANAALLLVSSPRSADTEKPLGFLDRAFCGRKCASKPENRPLRDIFRREINRLAWSDPGKGSYSAALISKLRHIFSHRPRSYRRRTRR